MTDRAGAAPARGGAQDVRAALARVREAGRALRARPRGSVASVLAELLERWRDPRSAPRRRLEAELPAATGFTAPVVREGLARALAPWTAEALLALVRSELGPGALGEADATPGAPRRLAQGFDLTAVLLAGALPTPTLLALVAPLLVGSAVVAKPASADPVTAQVVAESLAELDADLAAALCVLVFESADEARLDALLEAECVVATGSDETVTAVRARLHPAQRLVARGHRLSVALLGRDAHAGAALEEAMSALALDVALWDQLGCLSPVALWVVGDDAACDRAAQRLGAALAEAETRWPRGRVGVEAKAAIAAARAEAEMRAAAREGVALHGGVESGWTVVREADAGFRGSPLHRFVRVHRARDPDEALRALRPLGAHLAAVGLAGFGAGREELGRGIAGLGASRVCRFGSFQSPPLAWCQDNQGVLLPLTRLSDWEIGPG
jgi:hypothetical protein